MDLLLSRFYLLLTQRRLPQALLLDGLSPASRLLEKRRQMFEVQETLEAQKQDFNRKVWLYRACFVHSRVIIPVSYSLLPDTHTHKLARVCRKKCSSGEKRL